MKSTLTKLIVGISFGLALGGCNEPQESELPRLGNSPVEEVVAAMTLEEKVKLLSSNGFQQPGNSGGIMTLGHVTYGVPRLGIPKIVFSDGPAGIHFSEKVKDEKPATTFPSATTLASTWNTNLMHDVGFALGHEAKEYGIDILLVPGMNAHRHPLGGRAFEYYSEDPLISGKMAASYVNGLQSNGVGTSVKHFVANEQETFRNVLNTHVSERALRELYLKSFKIAIQEAHPWSVMTSLNAINGQSASESEALLDTILRQEWGFDGFVMTDWYGGKDAIAQVIAGNDLLTPGDSTKDVTPGKENQEKMILEGIKSGQLAESKLDRNVTRFLKAILKSQTFKGYEQSNAPDLATNARISYKAAAEGIVLLKNKAGVLPFSADSLVALYGNSSVQLIPVGKGSGFVWSQYDNPIDGAFQSKGITINNDLLDQYREYLATYHEENPEKSHIEELFDPTPVAPEMIVDRQLILSQAKEYDIAVITLGRVAGENVDNKESYFEISENEHALINTVAEAYHSQNKHVVVVLNTAGVIDVASWESKVDAILIPWLPGQEGGNVIVDTLIGINNPSGRLATTIPKTLDQLSTNKNFPGTFYPEKAEPGFMEYEYHPGDVIYEEGIYVGYRYFNSFDISPAYPFGYGLSYTTFDYSQLKFSQPVLRGSVNVSVTVTNSGSVSGQEVIQLYVSAPQASLEKPARELKAFAKTRLLKPGESEIVTLKLSVSDVSSFDSAQSAWIAEGGDYNIQIGKNVNDIILSKTLSLPQSVIVEKTNKVLMPEISINELSRARD